MTKSKTRRLNSGLGRWFAEEWIDVCQLPKIVKCGRDKAKWKNYPYCRPRKRINKSTPKTAGELSKAEIKKRCSNPTRRVLPKRKSKSRRKSKRRKSPKRKSKSRRKSKRRKSPKRKSKSRRKSKRRKSPKRKSKSTRRK
jgi:hypothetical protein